MKLICKSCNNEFDSKNFYIHLRSHNLNPCEYYYKYLYETNLCLNCNCKLEYRHSISRSISYRFCSKSCAVSYRDKMDSKLNKNPFQSINLARDETGKSITHIKGNETLINEGRHNFLNTGSIEVSKRLSEMHRKTALKQILNGNSIYSKKFDSSKIELKLGDLLKELDIKYIPQFNDKRWNKPYQADYYLPDYNLILECDGDFKYEGDKLKEKYIIRKQIIESTSGIKVINIKASSIYEMKSNNLHEIIKQCSTTIPSGSTLK